MTPKPLEKDITVIQNVFQASSVIFQLILYSTMCVIFYILQYFTTEVILSTVFIHYIQYFWILLSNYIPFEVQS